MVIDYYQKAFNKEMLLSEAYIKAREAYSKAAPEDVAAYGDMLARLEQRMAHFFMISKGYRLDFITNEYVKKPEYN